MLITLLLSPLDARIQHILSKLFVRRHEVLKEKCMVHRIGKNMQLDVGNEPYLSHQ